METSSTIFAKDQLGKRCDNQYCNAPVGTHQQFCSARCLLDAEKRQRIVNEASRQKYGIAEAIDVEVAGDPVRAGAMAEHVAIIDLMRHRFDVYRAVSSASSCDLVAIRDEEIIRIEVRCGYYTKSKGVRCNRKKSDQGKSDMYAMVVNGREVHYDPPLPGTEKKLAA
jgi:predicted nucleic acid-binding Zn ribbon protein